MVTMVTRVDTAAAPTEKAVAGFRTFVICEVNLVDPSERYFCRCSRIEESAQRAVSLLGLAHERAGPACRSGTRAVTSGSVNRYTRPITARAPTRKTTRVAPAVAEAATPQEPRGRRQEQREEEGDDDVDDDVAQDPEAEDQGRIEVQQQNDRGDRDHDRPQRDARADPHSPRIASARSRGPSGAWRPAWQLRLPSGGSSVARGPRASMRSDARGGTGGGAGAGSDSRAGARGSDSRAGAEAATAERASPASDPAAASATSGRRTPVAEAPARIPPPPSVRRRSCPAT